MNNLYGRISIIPAALEILLAVVFMICFSHFANASTMEDAEKLVVGEIEKSTGLENAGVKFVKGQAYLNNIKTDKLQLTSLNVDGERRTFTGYISINGNIPIPISGRFFKSVKVPVLNMTATRMDIIKPEDISYVEMDSDRAAQLDIITSANEIIGKSPTRGIYKNRPINRQQIGNAKLIAKQQDVTILFKSGNMEIRDLGTAIDDGGKGDVIRVRNKTSNKIVTATIVDGKTTMITRGGGKLAGL